jgi:hypothetical protein
MTSGHSRNRLLIWLFAGAVLSVNAQVSNTPTLNVKDVDQEGRNAYQEACLSVARFQIGQCEMPPLPPGKRLAIRWVSASCSPGASRVEGIQVVQELRDATDQTGGGIRFGRSRIQPFGLAGERVLEEPVYAHSDTPPRVTVFQRDDGSNTPVQCNVSVRGYLLNK